VINVSIPAENITNCDTRNCSTELTLFYYHIYLYHDHNLQESAVCV